MRGVEDRERKNKTAEGKSRLKPVRPMLPLLYGRQKLTRRGKKLITCLDLVSFLNQKRLTSGQDKMVQMSSSLLLPHQAQIQTPEIVQGVMIKHCKRKVRWFPQDLRNKIVADCHPTGEDDKDPFFPTRDLTKEGSPVGSFFLQIKKESCWQHQANPSPLTKRGPLGTPPKISSSFLLSLRLSSLPGATCGLRKSLLGSWAASAGTSGNLRSTK